MALLKSTDTRQNEFSTQFTHTHSQPALQRIWSAQIQPKITCIALQEVAVQRHDSGLRQFAQLLPQVVVGNGVRLLCVEKFLESFVEAAKLGFDLAAKRE